MQVWSIRLHLSSVAWSGSEVPVLTGTDKSLQSSQLTEWNVNHDKQFFLQRTNVTLWNRMDRFAGIFLLNWLVPTEMKCMH